MIFDVLLALVTAPAFSAAFADHQIFNIGIPAVEYGQQAGDRAVKEIRIFSQRRDRVFCVANVFVSESHAVDIYMNCDERLRP